MTGVAALVAAGRGLGRAVQTGVLNALVNGLYPDHAHRADQDAVLPR